MIFYSMRIRFVVCLCCAGLLVSCQNPQAQTLVEAASGIMMRRGMISAKDARDLRLGGAVLFGNKFSEGEEEK